MTYEIDGEKPTGAMIALIPENPASIALTDGEPEEVLHVTVKFLGDADDWDADERDRLAEALAGIAASTDPIDMECEGCEMFGKENDALAMKFKSPTAHALHKIAHALTPDVELTWPDYRPHLTLGYVRDQDPHVEEHDHRWKGKHLTCDKVRLAFGEDVRDFPLGVASDEAELERVLDMAAAAVLIAAAVPPSKEPKRAAPNQLTEKEIEQRRNAALKSAEARRKKGNAAFTKMNQGADARTRANREFYVKVVNENAIKDFRKQLQKPNLSYAQRVMIQTALDNELAARRDFQIAKVEESRRLSKELGLAQQELARAERLFDVDKINELRKVVEGLQKEVDARGLADEIVRVSFDDHRQAEREAARAAAEARRERDRQVREFKRAVAERERERKKRQREQEARLKKFYRGVESAKKKASAAKKKSSSKKKGSETKNYLTPAEKKKLLAGR